MDSGRAMAVATEEELRPELRPIESDLADLPSSGYTWTRQEGGLLSISFRLYRECLCWP